MKSTLFVQDQHLFFFLVQAIGSYVFIINTNSEHCIESCMIFWWCKRFNTCETHAFNLSTHFFSILRLNGVAILMSHLLCSARCVNIQIPMQIRPKFVTDRMVCVCVWNSNERMKRRMYILTRSCQFTLVIVSLRFYQ